VPMVPVRVPKITVFLSASWVDGTVVVGETETILCSATRWRNQVSAFGEKRGVHSAKSAGILD